VSQILSQYYIAGDWGTSNLRLYLCLYQSGKGSSVIDTRYGLGIGQLQRRDRADSEFETEFFKLSQDWFDQHGNMPVILSGMVGSTIGWKDAPYLDCPVDAERIAHGRFSFSARGIDFSVLGGLKTINPLGLPDVMRGEELQLLGWQLLNSGLQGDRLFALPGTHNKWSLCQQHQIKTFLSAFTGELYEILGKHSILIAQDSQHQFDEPSFIEGVNTAQKLGQANILHALFSVRSRQVLGEITAEQSSSYLSGLIIAADVVGAYQVFNSQYSKDPSNDPLGVTIIGESQLSQNYLLALSQLGIPAERVEPSIVAIAGFSAIYQYIYDS